MDDLFSNRRVLHFIAIYEAKSIHRAAETLAISQPALTVSLKHLEQDLGTRLFDRSVKGMTPTSAGDVMYSFAVTLREGARNATQAIGGLGQHGSQQLRIGAGVAWATTILPAILKTLHGMFPTLSVDLVTGVGEQLALRLIAGELDVVVAAGALKNLSLAEIKREYLGNLPMKAVADRHSRLAKLNEVSPRDLASVGWVSFYEDDSMIYHSDHYLGKNGLPPAHFVMRTNSPTSLTSFMFNTEFVAVLIAPLADAATKSGLRELKTAQPLWELPVNIYCRALSAQSAPIRSFIAEAKGAIRTMS